MIQFNRQLFLLTVTALALMLLSACGKNATQEGLGKAVFKALKNNDYKRFEKYILRKNEFRKMVLSVKDSPLYQKYSPQKKQHYARVVAALDPIYQRHLTHLKKNFHTTFDEGVRLGITWSKTKLVKVLIEERPPALENEDYVQQNLYIVFSFNGTQYKLRLKNGLKLTRGWVVVDGFFWETLPGKNQATKATANDNTKKQQ